jgi:hypothetical protein
MSIAILQEDITAKQNKETQEKLDDALLGFAKADFIAMAPTFGRYNPRAVDLKQVTKMVESMLQNGFHRYVQTRMVNIMVAKGEVDSESLTMDPGKGGDEFPVLRFTVNKPQVFLCISIFVSD